MMNEFQRIDLRCEGASLIPYGPGYSDIAHQACTLPGGAPGSDVISGSAYVSSAFQYDPGQLWRNYGMALLHIVFRKLTCSLQVSS